MTDRTAEKSNRDGNHPAPGSTEAGKPASASGSPAGSSPGGAAPGGRGGPGASGSGDGPSGSTEARRESKPPITERIQSALSRAAAEHRANAGAAPGSAAGPREDDTRPRRPVVTGDRGRSRAPRRARLRMTRVDPWSVMKTSFLLSIAFSVVLVVSVAMVWSVLGAAGVWDSINTTVQSVLGGETASSFDVKDYVGTSRVLGFTMLVAALDVVLLTAMATLGAFLYNMAAALLGGIEVTLAEDVG